MKKMISYFCIALLTIASSASAYAGVISSDKILQSASSQYQKSEILSMVDSAEVQQKLIELGVNPQVAKDRINAMTPSELASVNAEMDDMPAGGIVGTVVTVFVVLFVLDILGVTDVFDFINPI